MTNEVLKNCILKLPSGSGIYTFKDARKKYLYIGKASNLKSRVGSYLPSRQAGLKTEDQRIVKMVESAKSLKFISTQSNIEALILESQLIKKFQPRFNIVMRDDKQYSFVMFTGEKYQKIFTTHQPQSHEETIGPFTDAGALKTTLRLLRRIFPYCTCKQTHHNYCLNYHIGKCLGFCCLKQQNPRPQGSTLKKSQGRTLNSYRKNISSIKKILNGKKTSLVKDLKKEMVLLAKKGNLEKALELQNKSGKLERIFENARIIKHSEITKDSKSGLENLLKIRKPIIRIEGYDVSNIQGIHATGSMVTFIHGQSDKNFYRKFKIYTKQTPNDVAMLKEVIERRFKHYEWPFPDLILIDGGKGQVNTIVKTLKNMAIKIPVVGISKNERHIGHKLIIPNRKSPLSLSKLSPADRNLLLTIDSEAHRFAIGYYRKLHRRLFR